MSEPEQPKAARKRPSKRPRLEWPLRGHHLFNEIEWQAIRRVLDLSRREFDIIQGLFDDRSKPQIATALGLSSHTIHTYLSRLYRKLGVRSRPAVLLRVFEAYLRSFPRKSSDIELLRDLFGSTQQSTVPDGRRAGYSESGIQDAGQGSCPEAGAGDTPDGHMFAVTGESSAGGSDHSSRLPD